MKLINGACCSGRKVIRSNNPSLEGNSPQHMCVHIAGISISLVQFERGIGGQGGLAPHIIHGSADRHNAAEVASQLHGMPEGISAACCAVNSLYTACEQDVRAKRVDTCNWHCL